MVEEERAMGDRALSGPHCAHGGLQVVRLEAGDARLVARATGILRPELQETMDRRTVPLTLPAAVGPSSSLRAGPCHWA